MKEVETTAVAVRKRTELNITPSPPIITPTRITATSPSSSSSSASSPLSCSPTKKSGIPMPINGQIILKKEPNHHHHSSSSGEMYQEPSSSFFKTFDDDDDPLCDDILSCISALDEVIAEFDDPISLTSLPPTPCPPSFTTSSPTTPSASFDAAGALPLPSPTNNHLVIEEPVIVTTRPTQKPTFSRLITTLSTHPQEPSVTIMQKESQTVTKIQIGSSSQSNNKTSCSSASSSTATTPSPTSAVAAVSVVSWKTPQVTVSQNSTTNHQQQHYSKRQQQPQVVHLKQSDFTPSKPKKTPATFTSNIYQDPEPIETTTFVATPVNHNNSNHFANYELIFPKSPNTQQQSLNAAVGKKSVNGNNYSESVGAQLISQSKISNGGVGPGGSFPKVKSRLNQQQAANNNNNNVIMESQSVKVRQLDSSSASSHKPLPASFKNNNVLIREEDAMKEHWSFLSDENLPRSLRKTRKVILDEDDDGKQGGGGKLVNFVTSRNNPVLTNDPVAANCNQHGNNFSNVNQNQNNVVVAGKKLDEAQRYEQEPIMQDPPTAVTRPVRSQKKLKMMMATADGIEMKTRSQETSLNNNINVNNNVILSNSYNNDNDNNPARVESIVNQNHVNHNGMKNHPALFLPLAAFPPEPEQDEMNKRIKSRQRLNLVENLHKQGHHHHHHHHELQKSGNGSSPDQNGSSHHHHHYHQPHFQPSPNHLMYHHQLDVDDGYLSMINRHDPPIIWPETYIESETFTPKELKRLSRQSANGRNSAKSNKLMSSLTTSEEKTDYFSDDSLEIEENENNENVHLSYVIETNNSGGHGGRAEVDREPNRKRRARGRCEKDSSENGRNVWRKPSNNVDIIISPVKKPCAFFIPLNESQVLETKATETSLAQDSCSSPSQTTSPAVLMDGFSGKSVDNVTEEEDEDKPGNTECAQIEETKEELVNPIVNAILENVLKVGIQEASAINFLLASAAQKDDEEAEELKNEAREAENSIVSKVNKEPQESEILEQGSCQEIFGSFCNEFPARTSQYEADCEEDDDDDEDEVSGVQVKSDAESKKCQEWNHDVEFVEDFDQPPPFIPPPPVQLKIILTSPEVPKVTESVTVVKSHINNYDRVMPLKQVGNISSNQSCTRKSSEPPGDDLNQLRNSIVLTKSYHRSVDPEVDYRVKMQRQASRSHENLLDIKGRRQHDFLTPKRSHGQSCTLPPNSVPPVCQRRHSAFRQFLGGIFRRNKKAELNSSSADVPDSPFEDIQFSFGRRNIFPALPEDHPLNHEMLFHERKLSFTNSPHGSQRSTRSTPVKKSVLSRIFRRKEK